MKKLTIELEGAWVLKHREDEKLPISAIKESLEKISGVRVEESSLTALTVIYADNNEECACLKDHVLRIFAERYPQDTVSEIVSFEVSDVKNPEKTEAAGKAGESETAEIFSDEDGGAPGESSLERLFETSGLKKQSRKEDDGVSAIDKIDALVGAAELKALAHEISSVADEIKRAEAYELFMSRCYLFSIGDGYGLTTYLELMAKLVSECGLCNMANYPVKEVQIGAYRESMEPFEAAMRALDSGSEKNIRVLCIDISEWMDRTDNRYFKQFLRAAQKHADEFIVVFRVPFVDKDILARINYSLSDLLSVKSVSFPPLSREEIKLYAEAELKRLHFSIAKAAWEYFFERIAEEKSDGKFYGVNTVKKVVRELVYQKHLTNSKKKNKSKQINPCDTKLLCMNTGVADLSGEEQLRKLVGVDGIKKRIEEIIAQIELAIQNGSTQRPCIHMRFVGNPGTGKTTVARIIGKILKEKGILRVGAFFEYAGRDFCGRYIGETAPKTASICRDAYGSVLFIDEAYSLYRGDGDVKDYGREAIDTLIAEMENHRNDFVVIMAGYTSDMEQLMGGNAGLASRMPYTVEFPNFTREQLYDIFVSMVKDKFRCEKELFDAARQFFDELPEAVLSSKEFANARYVRNLFERTWAKAAMRCQLGGKTDIVLTRDDFEHASADKEFATTVPKKTRLGF